MRNHHDWEASAMDVGVQKYLAFVETADRGSFTRAAEKLHYSQSGISRMIRDLETEWKVKDHWTGGNLKAEDLGNRSVRLYQANLQGRVGNVMNLGMARREVPCITVSDSRRFALHNVTIYHAGGMGVIAQRSRDLLLDSLVVKPAPGKDRVVSAAADATHFVNCSGYIHMYNCRFSNQTDDATNIHGVYYRITEVQRPQKVKVELANDAQYGFDYLKKGKRILRITVDGRPGNYTTRDNRYDSRTRQEIDINVRH